MFIGHQLYASYSRYQKYKAEQARESFYLLTITFKWQKIKNKNTEQ